MTNKKVDNVVIEKSVNVLTQEQIEEQENLARLAELSGVSVDTLKRLQGMTPSEQANLQKYASKVRQGDKPVKEEIPFMLTDIPENAEITLDQLIALDETPIENASVALRTLDGDNIESLRLAYEQDAPIPPLKLAGSSWGYIIIAGNHRNAAILKSLKLQFEREGKLDDEGKKLLKQAVSKFVVSYEAVNGKTERQLRDMAFFDNLTHGLRVSESSRSRYVIALMHEAENENRKFFMRPTCEMVGVKRQAVYQMIKRDATKAQKAESNGRSTSDFTVLDESDMVELKSIVNEAVEEVEKADVLESATKKLIAQMVVINNECEKNAVDSEELAEYFHDYVTNFKIHSSFELVGNALGLVQLTDEEISKLQ